ncbi:hypothetical protein [Actinoallomurus bryophytorum]|nr:hypothetical protein [Actinoallomurus bryophytorum]
MDEIAAGAEEPEIAVLPAEHPARPAVRPALWSALAGAVAFTVSAYVTTQVRAVRAGSPWQDDPYVGVVSFTEFLVPALAVLIAVRALLYRRAEPKPVFRTAQLLRAAFVCTLLVAATIAVDGLAVVLRADHALWNDGTPWLVAALAPLAALVAAALACEARAFRRLPPRDGHVPGGDWLDDLAVLAETLAVRLPPSGARLAVRIARGGAIEFAREHIMAVAALASLGAGLAIGVAQAVGEHWTSPVLFLTFAAIGTGGFFAFSMICNTALRIAAPREPASAGRVRRSARMAVIAGSLALPASAVLRDGIRTTLGLHGEIDNAGQLAVITFAGGLSAAVLVFAAMLVIARRDGVPVHRRA